MFVRLFVDENLDRIVPISKQPKEKIQAIIDSCTRQFPEFAERARKRIRTYLKSCRRNKRGRDGPWDAVSFLSPLIVRQQADQTKRYLNFLNSDTFFILEIAITNFTVTFEFFESLESALVYQLKSRASNYPLKLCS